MQAPAPPPKPLTSPWAQIVKSQPAVSAAPVAARGSGSGKPANQLPAYSKPASLAPVAVGNAQPSHFRTVRSAGSSPVGRGEPISVLKEDRAAGVAPPSAEAPSPLASSDAAAVTAATEGAGEGQIEVQKAASDSGVAFEAPAELPQQVNLAPMDG
jgi:hypothetical protein